MACQQTDVTRRVSDAFVGSTVCFAGSGEFGPLACELPPRFLFIIYAILQWLANSEPGRSGKVELATPRNIKLRHLVSHGNN
jgi:hypothetical protein